MGIAEAEQLVAKDGTESGQFARAECSVWLEAWVRG